MRFFNYTLYEAEIMTLREYSYNMHVFNLQRIDKERDMHYQAFLNHVVTGTKQQGKKTVPLFKTFKEFFDYDKEIARLTKPKIDVGKQNLAKLIARANSL